MTGSVDIGGKKIEISATLGAMLRYKEQFGREYTEDISELSKLKDNDNDKYISAVALTGFKLIWAMAKTADSSVPAPDVWAESFKDTDISMIMLEAVALFSQSLGDHSDENSENGEANEEFTTEGLTALCTLYGIGINELDRLSVDMVIRIMNEIAKLRTPTESKNADGLRKATPADIEAFFG